MACVVPVALVTKLLLTLRLYVYTYYLVWLTAARTSRSPDLDLHGRTWSVESCFLGPGLDPFFRRSAADHPSRAAAFCVCVLFCKSVFPLPLRWVLSLLRRVKPVAKGRYLTDSFRAGRAKMGLKDASESVVLGHKKFI